MYNQLVRLFLSVFILTLLFILASCSTIRKMGIRTTSGLIYEGHISMFYEDDFEYFKKASLANLKFIEGIYHQDPQNEDLLKVLIKGFAGYGFGVYETLDLEDQLSEKEERLNKAHAIAMYEKAFSYGLKYLEVRGVDVKGLLKEQKAKEIKELLNFKLYKADYETVFYISQSWGALINLQRDNITLMSDLTKVQIIFDWVCDKEPDVAFDGCLLFHGTFEATKPLLLGGDVEKAKKYFKKFIQKNPANLLGKVQYLQFLIIPHLMEEEYESLMNDLEKEFQLKDEMLVTEKYLASAKKKNKNEKFDLRVYNLFNSIARQRFLIFRKYEESLF